MHYLKIKVKLKSLFPTSPALSKDTKAPQVTLKTFRNDSATLAPLPII